MKTRSIFLWIFVALLAVTTSPKGASAQCWFCDTDCMWENEGIGCIMKIPTQMGWSNCLDYPFDGRCWCYTPGPYGNCWEVTAANAEVELTEVLAAIKAGESIPVDGSFFYVRRGPDLVVRRRCDMSEVARVSLDEVRPASTLAGG